MIRARPSPQCCSNLLRRKPAARSARVASSGEGGGESEDDRFLAIVFELGLAREGTAETAGLDQAAGTDPALGIFELGFLFGEAGFVLFIGADALGKRRAMDHPPGYRVPCQRARCSGRPGSEAMTNDDLRTDSAGSPARRAFCSSERLREVAANMPVGGAGFPPGLRVIPSRRRLKLLRNLRCAADAARG